MPNLTVCNANNMATAARRTASAAHGLADTARSAGAARTSRHSPASDATAPTASSTRSSTAGTRRSLAGAPLATIEASRMVSPAHTAPTTAVPRTPQRRTTHCVSGYPQALSPRTTAPAIRLITSAPSGGLPITPAQSHRSGTEPRAQGPAHASTRLPGPANRAVPGCADRALRVSSRSPLLPRGRAPA
jgi:hypothetical protein